MVISGKTDVPAYEIIDGDPALGLVLLGDHAMNRLPAEYGSLGLPDAAFERHIAYDIGIEPLVRSLAARLGAPAVLGCFSRLLIDPNRGEDDPTLIMKLSDGAIIAGNHPITAEEWETRLNRFHRPYHRAVSETIGHVATATGKAPLVISMHSYTPFWKGVPRPWQAAILWDNDPRAVEPLLSALRSEAGMLIGDNEPYDGALRNDTMFRHCMAKGIPHALIEVRQDLISTPEGVHEWAGRLAPILDDLNRRHDLHIYDIHPSRTGPYDT